MRFRDEQPGRIAVAVELNFSGRRRGGGFRIADSAQRRRVQKRPIVKMKYKDRGLRSGGVDLGKRRHPALGELELCPASDHAHPLGSGGPCCLLFQHPERFSQ